MTTFTDFPTEGVIVLKEGYSHDPGHGVEVFETDRSMPKMRLTNEIVIESTTFTLEFQTLAAERAFFNWYKSTLKRVGRFRWYDFLTGTTKTAWFKDGKVGESTPVTADYQVSRRTVTVQYLG